MNWTAMANMKGKQCWTSMFKAKPSTPHNEGHQGPSYEGTSSAERSLPETKPRWKPKPEQLRILISKFDSGMMKPCPDEIKRIRAQLQEFGEVEKANIVYWFQNRKFRSRQRQRNLQSVEENKTDHSKAIINLANATADSLYDNGEPYSSYVPAAPFSTEQEHFNVQMIEEMSNDQCSYMQATPFSTQQEDFNVQMNEEMSNDKCSYMQAVAATGGGLFNEGTGENFMSYEHSVRVLINNFSVEVPVGPINVRTFFGENAVLLHSTGEAVLVNEWGLTLECLQQGAEYYLI